METQNTTLYRIVNRDQELMVQFTDSDSCTDYIRNKANQKYGYSLDEIKSWSVQEIQQGGV